MFKMMVMLRRKPGMSDADFRTYYEEKHAILVRRSAPTVRRYVRNYLTPIGTPDYAPDESGAVDCIAEAWFESDAAFAAALAEMAASGADKAITADEEQLFDRGAIRWFRAEEVESDLAAPC